MIPKVFPTERFRSLSMDPDLGTHPKRNFCGLGPLAWRRKAFASQAPGHHNTPSLQPVFGALTSERVDWPEKVFELLPKMVQTQKVPKKVRTGARGVTRRSGQSVAGSIPVNSDSVTDTASPGPRSLGSVETEKLSG